MKCQDVDVVYYLFFLVKSGVSLFFFRRSDVMLTQIVAMMIVDVFLCKETIWNCLFRQQHRSHQKGL